MLNSIRYLDRWKPRLMKNEAGAIKNQQFVGFAQVTAIKNLMNKKKDKKQFPRSNSWNQGEPRKTICLEGCRYDVVRRMALELNFEEVTETDTWNIIWTDAPIALEKALEMRRLQDAHTMFFRNQSPLQKANHFPGMVEICRKDRLARNLNRMKESYPQAYSFFPKTWALPADIADLLFHAKTKKNATYICKPDAGCQGKGIFLIRNLKKLNPFAKVICQVYIPKPLLIDGYKFDLRIYILITCCDPLRVYIYNEGIARFATVKYSAPTDQNVDIVYMHLTNYSLNKFSQSYVPDGDGSKRKLSTVYDYLLAQGHDIEKMSSDIDELIVKTMIAAQPTLKHYYRSSFPKADRGCTCFEILGFDILIDEDLKPWLLEVNHSPSFNLDLPVDAEVKEALLRDTFNKLYLGNPGDKPPSMSTNISERKRLGLGLGSSTNLHYSLDKAGNQLSRALQIQFHHEGLRQGNYRLIYPADNCQQYADLVERNPILDFSGLPSRRQPVPVIARGGGESYSKYDYNQPIHKVDDYVVTRTVSKNGTVYTTKRSKNPAFVMQLDPDKNDSPHFNSSDLFKSGVAMANNPIVKGAPCFTFQNLEPGPNLFSDADEFNNNIPQMILDVEPSHEPATVPKKPVRRNIAKQALELAQCRRRGVIKDKAEDGPKKPEIEAEPKEEFDSSVLQGNEKSEGTKKIERLRLPPVRRVSSAQLNKADSNYKVSVHQDQVSVFKYPADGHGFASLLTRALADRRAEDADTMSLDKYYSSKKSQKSRVPTRSQSDANKSLRKVEKPGEKTRESVDKQKYIEEWIQIGARERARGLKQSQYASDVAEKHAYKRNRSLTMTNLGIHDAATLSDNQVDYRHVPKISPRSTKSKPRPLPIKTDELPDLEKEESERRNALKNREKAIKQLGVEAKAFEVIKRSGRMKVEDEYLYNKILFPDEDYHSALFPSPTTGHSGERGIITIKPSPRSKSKVRKQDSELKYRPFASQYQPFFQSPLSSLLSPRNLK